MDELNDNDDDDDSPMHGLARSRVRLPAVMLPRNNRGQDVHTPQLHFGGPADYR